MDLETENTQDCTNEELLLLQEELISEVKNKPILYDCSTNSNRNKLLREVAWAEIALKIGKNGTWCKSEWTKLRAGYNRRKKSLKGKTGQARKRIESWSLFLPLQFLDDYDVVASTTGNLASSSQSGNFETEPSPLGSDTGVELETSVEGEVDNETDETRSTTETRTRDVTYSLNKHKRPTTAVDEEIVKFLRRPRQEVDEHHHFGMTVAEQLRKSSPEVSSYAKCKIQQILHECRFPVVGYRVETLETFETL